MMRKIRFRFYFVAGLFLSMMCLFTSCVTSPSSINNFDSAYQYLQNQLLPNIQVDSALVSDAEAQDRSIPPLADPLPDVEAFPLYGAKPTNDPGKIYVEIFSSTEKGNGDRQDERWLVDVAEAFNKQQHQVSGQVIQVGIRSVPSGLGAQLLGTKKVQPTAYTPATDLWLQQLKRDNVPFQMVTPQLIPNQAIFAVSPQTYQALEKGGEVTFDRLMDSILAGKITVGYSNPYIASSALNFLYTLLWRSAGHHQDGKLLTQVDLQLPQVTSAFDRFQKQIVVSTLTYLDLKQIIIRDPQKFQAFVMAYQSFVNLKKQPGFQDWRYVPYGVPENSPLVSFDWTTPSQQAALQKFAAFATSVPMQKLGQEQGFEKTTAFKEAPPLPSGEVLQAAQSFWKKRKDGGKTVYMELVIDTSGSMEEGQRLKAVQEALRFASRKINSGNQVGLITFSDRPVRRINFAPFNELEQKRLLTAIDELQPDGATSLYDAVAAGLGDLMDQQKRDPDGRFYLLLLTDGERTDGLDLLSVRDVIKHSGVRVYPIAYGKVNQAELKELAAIREGSVYSGNPETVQTLLRDLFQTNL
jgi:Ca-activated chloride channel homolog